MQNIATIVSEINAALQKPVLYLRCISISGKKTFVPYIIAYVFERVGRKTTYTILNLILFHLGQDMRVCNGRTTCFSIFFMLFHF